MIYIASDHIGLNLKKYLIKSLIQKGYDVVDLGTKFADRVNYTDYAKILSEKILSDTPSKGILICGSGIGMSMMANRHKKIRAALCINEYMAEMARKHNDANVLCLGSRVVGEDLALSIAVKFLFTDFEGGRHIKRIEQLDY